MEIFTLTVKDAGRYQCATQGPNDSTPRCLSETHLSILSEYESAKVTYTTQYTYVMCKLALFFPDWDEFTPETQCYNNLQ